MPDEPMIPRRTYETERHDWFTVIESHQEALMRYENAMRQIREIIDEALRLRNELKKT